MNVVKIVVNVNLKKFYVIYFNNETDIGTVINHHTHHYVPEFVTDIVNLVIVTLLYYHYF